MPVTSSAKKAMRQAGKRRIVNKKFKDDMKISMTVFEKKITKKQTVSSHDVDKVYGTIDKALKKHLLHKNTAARRKSLVAKMYNSTQS